ncbi:MAG: LamG domain-containing protein, partial [Gemmatimonadetes bacterium]|nr:LamG domain-containing protein [Gemmatimonadota bacterium]
MATWVPKVDARPQGAEVDLTEVHRIVRYSNVPPFTVQLSEVPLEGSVVIPGFTEVTTGPLWEERFRVHYARDRLPGRIEFSPDAEYATVNISYKGMGSPIMASDINTLQTNKLDSAFTTIADEFGQVVLTANGASTLRVAPEDGLSIRFDQWTNTLFIGNSGAPRPWWPTDLPDCVLWLDAERIGLNDGVEITQWNDRSQLRSAAVSSAPPRPTLKRGVRNGRAAVRFSAGAVLSTNPGWSGGGLTIFAVASRLSSTAGWQYLIGQDRSMAIGAYGPEMATRYGDGSEWTGGGSYGADAPLETNKFHLMSVVYDGSTERSYLDVQLVASRPASMAGFWNPQIGAGPDGTNGWDGYLAELLVYHGALDSASRRQVEDYLIDKYALSAPARFSPFRDIEQPVSWFDAGTLPLLDGETVSTWGDRRSASRSLVQSEPTQQPVYRAGVANGRHAVRFDGVDDVLTLASELSARHVFVVLGNHVPNGSSQSVFGAISDDQGFDIASTLDSAGRTIQTFRFRSGLSVPLQGHVLAPTSGFSILHVAADETEMSLSLNGVLDLTTPYESTYVLGQIGGRGTPVNQFLQADVAEIVIFDTDLSVEDRKTVEQYLADKYRIEVHHDVPADVPGTRLWLDGGTLSPSSPVASWADQSQRGNHVV